MNTSAAISRNLWTTFFTIVFFGGSAIAWATFVPLKSAIIASGVVVVEANIKKVQHPTGGVVKALYVEEGQRVTAGEIVARLDDTTTRANWGIILNELHALQVRRVRLIAEQLGRDEIIVPSKLIKRAQQEASFKEIIYGERTLFASRRATKAGQRAQLRERVAQMLAEVSGLEKQHKALNQQLSITETELSDLSVLKKQGLVQRPRITSLLKEISRAHGLIGDNEAKIAKTQGRIAETKLQALQIDKDFSAEAARELRDVETRIAELMERKSAAEDQLRRVDIRAPISGIVHQLTIHTVGGVISPAEPIMMIVPTSAKLTISARVSSMDIDQIHYGQPVRVRFSAFDRNTTPSLNGTVHRIGAALSNDEKTGQTYYSIGIEISPSELSRLGSLHIVPGMPIEVHITTGQRTTASYLLKPLLDQMQRAMREK